MVLEKKEKVEEYILNILPPRKRRLRLEKQKVVTLSLLGHTYQRVSSIISQDGADDSLSTPEQVRSYRKNFFLGLNYTLVKKHNVSFSGQVRISDFQAIALRCLLDEAGGRPLPEVLNIIINEIILKKGERLSEKKRNILIDSLCGFTTHDLAKKYGFKVKTGKYHLTCIYSKLKPQAEGRGRKSGLLGYTIEQLILILLKLRPKTRSFFITHELTYENFVFACHRYLADRGGFSWDGKDCITSDDLNDSRVHLPRGSSTVGRGA